MLHDEKLDDIIFYSIDRAIRTYRQYAQQQIRSNGFTITIDQWLVIKCLMENPEITQVELAEKIFKDTASVTRILSLLVKAKYISRKVSKADRRRSSLTVTQAGIDIIEAVNKIVLINRAHALKNVSAENLSSAKMVMDAISGNCSKTIN